VDIGSWPHDDLIGLLRRGLDGLVIFFAYWAANAAYSAPSQTIAWFPPAAAALVFWLVSEINGLYRISRSHRWAETRGVLLSWATVPAVLGLLAFSTKTSADYSRVVSFSWFLATPLGLFLARSWVGAFLGYARGRGWNVRRLAIAGAVGDLDGLCAALTADPWQGARIQGIFDDRIDPKRRSDSASTPRGGSFADLVQACRAGTIDVVYLNLPLAAQRRTERLLRELADSTATVFLVADFFTYDLMCARWSVIGRYPVVSVYDTPFRGRGGVLKRIEDIVLGSAILLLISLPMVAIAVAIKLTSRGPALFRQRRYGLNGKEIRVFKFRTMTVCEDGPKVAQATRDDRRITPLGRFLRRTSLDELPQFLQVITGEMSIVGPRPHAVAHNEEYRSIIQGYMLRHKVKPGITGWAQVNGWRGETPEVSMMEKRVRHDLDYIKNWSLFLDVKIIFLTIFGRKKNLNAY
jgi:putative colanic acid biosynthesis UDP-glucose lipid carrier transferase